SYNALLLESAQALDEASGAAAATDTHAIRSPAAGLAALTQVDGVEFVLTAKGGGKNGEKKGGEKLSFESRGLENPERLATWTRARLDRFRALGDKLQAGPLEQIEALGPQRHVALAQPQDTALCVGWRSTLSA